jgi:hypothetical protein
MAPAMIYCVLAFGEEGERLFPWDPVPVIDPSQATRLARHIESDFAGVMVYGMLPDPSTGAPADIWVLSRRGRMPTTADVM